MKAVNEILDRLENGEKPKDLKNQYRWFEFTFKEREALIQKAEELLDAPKGHPFIHTLIRLTWNNDDWDFIRTGTLLLRRSDTQIDEKDTILDYMKKAFDRIREDINSDDVDRYHLWFSDYKILTAKFQEENGNLDIALQNYYDALDTYQNIEANDKVDEAKRQIEKINLWRENKAFLIPLSTLQDERILLNQEIDELQNRQNQISKVLKKSRAEVNSLNEQKQILENEVDDRRQEIIGINVHIDDLNGEISKKDIRLDELGDVLEFMISLPLLSTGPLWVEVLRIAIEQGEIDDLSLQALERLSINGSTEAKKLLSEISARLPEGKVIDHIKFESELTRWFAGIAKAKYLREDDPLSAAHIMTETWEAFLKYIEASTTNG